MVKLDAGSASFSGGYSTLGSSVTPQMLADTVNQVEQHQYRTCDMGREIMERVRESFQRMGYFCVDVEPIAAQQDEKNHFKVGIRSHPGEQYRLKDVTFSGATLLSNEELRSTFRLKPNSLFDTVAVARGLEALRGAYAKKGNTTMTALPSVTLDEKSKTIALEISIHEGATLQ